MNKDNLWWLLLLVAAVLMFSNVEAGEWNDKPVMCAPTKQTLKAIQSKGEILLMTGVQSTKVRNPDEPNGLAANPVHLAKLNKLEKQLSENLMQADGKTHENEYRPFWINYRSDIPNCLMVIREYSEMLRQYDSKQTLER